LKNSIQNPNKNWERWRLGGVADLEW